MVGRDLMQRHGQKPQIVMTTPILEGIDARIEDGKVVGKKMSKSADNYIGLTEPPLEMYRKCMQIDDGVIWRYFELLSDRSTEEIRSLRERGHPLDAKASFAHEIVARFHGAEAADRAQTTFRQSYLSSAVPSDTPEVAVSAEGASLLLAKALSTANLVTSTGEGRRLISQGGVEVDGQRVTDQLHRLERGRRYLVRVGSKRRRFCYLKVAP
jgi:tyrosyl-tRNA synthetase